jgi:ABC-type phosphate transport system substrate-binding protein
MGRKTALKILLLFELLAMLGVKARADISVIVNPSNDVSLNQEEIKNIFLAKKNRFPNDVPAKPVDQQDGRPIRKEFYSKLIGMDENDLKSYWSVLIFTGNASPPKVISDDEAVKTYIKSNPAGLGYIDSKAVDASVKVIFTAK